MVSDLISTNKLSLADIYLWLGKGEFKQFYQLLLMQYWANKSISKACRFTNKLLRMILRAE